MSRELLKDLFFYRGTDTPPELYERIRAELAKPEPFCFAKWWPIETAPKDGTEILLFALYDIGLCYWSDNMDSWTWGAGNRFNNPSHWMPLPEVPSKCTHPPAQQKPVYLSDSEVDFIISSPFMNKIARQTYTEFARAIEKAVLKANGLMKGDL